MNVTKNCSLMLHQEIANKIKINSFNSSKLCNMIFDMFVDTLYNERVVNNLLGVFDDELQL